MDKDSKANKDLDHIENIFGQISDFQDRINALLDEVNGVYVFDENQAQIEQELNTLTCTVQAICAQSKQLIQTTQSDYIRQQDFVPSDIAQELTSLELLSERLQGAMEEKDREFKRAKTVRTDYLSGVDCIQHWLHNAELRIQDRSTEPLQLKETLNKIHQEIAGIQERLENVKQNGNVIIEKSRNDDEKILIRNTIEQLTQQMDQLRTWLDDKKHQVGDSLDAWTRFMNLYQIVISWAAEKKIFLAAPLNVVTLQEARHKMNEYSVFIWMNVACNMPTNQCFFLPLLLCLHALSYSECCQNYQTDSEELERNGQGTRIDYTSNHRRRSTQQTSRS